MKGMSTFNRRPPSMARCGLVWEFSIGLNTALFGTMDNLFMMKCLKQQHVQDEMGDTFMKKICTI